ncbi:MAG: putative lipid II flippase FtsW, partial [Planctomycetota bacterium]
MNRLRNIRPEEILVSSVILLLTIGTVMIFSAGAFYHHVSDPFHFLRRQMLWLPIAILCGILFSSVDYRVFRRMYPLVFLGSIVLLVLVLIPNVGRNVNNSSRWLTIGSQLRFQPSEAAKLAIVLFVAGYLAKDPTRTKSYLRGFIPVGIGTFLVFGLILREPDLGSSVFVLGLGTAVMLVAGMRIRYLATSAAAVVPVIYFYVLEHWETVQRRVLGFLDPENPEQHQVYHSLIALGSGGWAGNGLGASAEKLRYLPEAHTDFIFAVIGEELGFVGCVAILFVFVTLVASAAKVALGSRDYFGFLVGSGITIALGFQALVNVAVVTGSVPTKGMSLPLLSFGGSGLCMMLAEIGILLSIARVARTEEGVEERQDLIDAEIEAARLKEERAERALLAKEERAERRAKKKAARKKKKKEPEAPSPVARGAGLSAAPVLPVIEEEEDEYEVEADDVTECDVETETEA